MKLNSDLTFSNPLEVRDFMTLMNSLWLSSPSPAGARGRYQSKKRGMRGGGGGGGNMALTISSCGFPNIITLSRPLGPSYLKRGPSKSNSCWQKMLACSEWVRAKSRKPMLGQITTIHVLPGLPLPYFPFQPGNQARFGCG